MKTKNTKLDRGTKMQSVISLFSGAGGLDKGFMQAGFTSIWACENNRQAAKVYAANIGNHVYTDTIEKVKEFPSADGVIGGPPCTAWSVAGAMRGFEDPRGKLFEEYIRAIAQVKPKFFLAENVPGLLSGCHKGAYERIVERLVSLGYRVNGKVLNAADYDVPQDRKRLIIVGYRDNLRITPTFPKPSEIEWTLRDVLSLLPEHPVLSQRCTSGYSSQYMSRNRCRGWNEPSYTILATASQAPQHPDSVMLGGRDGWWFANGVSEAKRLSAIECARIQTFPDTWDWLDSSLPQAYKMIGNAVPVTFAQHLAQHIKGEIYGN